MNVWADPVFTQFTCSMCGDTIIPGNDMTMTPRGMHFEQKNCEFKFDVCVLCLDECNKRARGKYN